MQVQINKQTTITSLKKSVPQTVATVLVPGDESMSADEIRKALIEAILI